MPEITVLVDVSVEVARLRLQERSDGASNHYDTRGVAFHQNIYNGLHSMAADNSERFVVIDGQGAQELVAANILQVICSKLKIGLEI